MGSPGSQVGSAIKQAGRPYIHPGTPGCLTKREYGSIITHNPLNLSTFKQSKHEHVFLEPYE